MTAAVAEMAMGIDTKKNSIRGSNKIKFIDYSSSMKEFNAIPIAISATAAVTIALTPAIVTCFLFRFHSTAFITSVHQFDSV